MASLSQEHETEDHVGPGIKKDVRDESQVSINTGGRRFGDPLTGKSEQLIHIQ